MKEIIQANTLREAKQIAFNKNPFLNYEKVYKYTKGKGNNFYQFKV